MPPVLEAGEEGDAMDTSSPSDAPPEFEQPLPPEYRSTFHFISMYCQCPCYLFIILRQQAFDSHSLRQ